MRPRPRLPTRPRTAWPAPGLAALLLALAPAMAGADSGLELSGTAAIESDSAWRLRSPRQLQKSENRLEMDLELRLTPSLELRLKGRALYDPASRLVGSSPDPGYRPIDRAQLGGSRRAEAELREVYLEWTGRVGAARVDLRVGKQQVVWGQAFGLRVLDIVNAQDLREYILDDFVDSRIPTFALRADALVRGVSVQALVVPDFEADRYPDGEGEFAFDPAVPNVTPGVAPLPAAAGPGALVAPGDGEVPHDWRFRSLGYGVRVGLLQSSLDLAVHYWDRPDPRPALRRRITSQILPGIGAVPLNRIEPVHPRVRTLGLSFATALADLAFWGEGGISSGRAFAVDDLSDSDGLVSRNDLQYALGVDWSGRDDFFSNIQWIQYLVLGHDSRIQVDRAQSYLSLLLRDQWREGELIPQLFVIYGLDQKDSMIRPSLEWRPNDRLAITAGLDLFTGPRQGYFGQFARERACAPIPALAPVPGAGTCGFDPPPGRASRAFIRLRYAFELGG